MCVQVLPGSQAVFQHQGHGGKAQAGQQHAVGAADTERKYRSHHGGNIHHGPVDSAQKGAAPLRIKPFKNQRQKDEAAQVKDELPAGTQADTQQQSPARRAAAACSAEVLHSWHDVVEQNALASFGKGRRIGGKHGKQQREEQGAGSGPAVLARQREHEQKTQYALRRNHTSQRHHIQPEQFQRDTERQGQQPVSGQQAHEQGRKQRSVNKAKGQRVAENAEQDKKKA